MSQRIDTDMKYDWIIVGGGISGIAVAEILCREGKKVLLLEKNNRLASETSKVFHEWMHSGTLYTLAPDKLLTLRYLLGATDDLFEYYSLYPNMNLIPTGDGMEVGPNGWFNDRSIQYKFRVRKFNPVWMMMVSRSMELVKLVSKHDWLRRRAGAEYGRSNLKLDYWFRNVTDQMSSKEKFISVPSPDITMNSRKLMSDLLNQAMQDGLEVLVDSEVVNIKDIGSHVSVSTQNGTFFAKHAVVCSPDFSSRSQQLPIKTGYAPIAVVEGLDDSQESFVELDYNVKKCINLIVKNGGIGQAGGITLNRKADVQAYLEYIVAEHKKRVPSLKLIDSYVGIKKELIKKSEERNYLYHIYNTSNNVWSVVLGKFSLAFSAAPEFYRRVYKKNPSKSKSIQLSSGKNALISETAWQEIVNQNR